jgi:hypothetical protein
MRKIVLIVGFFLLYCENSSTMQRNENNSEIDHGELSTSEQEIEPHGCSDFLKKLKQELKNLAVKYTILFPGISCGSRRRQQNH